MNNLKPLISPVIIVLGIIALALGIFLLVGLKYTALHPLRAYIAIGVGIVLIIAGITIMIINRDKRRKNSN